MSVQTKVCRKCGLEFDLSPNKPGFIDVCPECTAPHEVREEQSRQEDQLRKSKQKASRKHSKDVHRNAADRLAMEALGFEVVRHLKAEESEN